MTLTTEQLDFWKANGYLHFRRFWPEIEALDQWTKELQQWPEMKGKWMKYFEDSLNDSNRILCRVENFLEYHANWREIIQDPRVYTILQELFGEPAILFKEKINFKFSGANGFAAHQDAPAFASFGQRFHITAMISIDPSNSENGCLEMAPGMHKSGLLEMTEAKELTDQVVGELVWEMIETEPGDLLLFDSFIPHRSGPNRSDSPRRAAYITYNPRADGSYRTEYYETKRAVFPPEIEREAGKDYSNSGLFNIGNPIRKE